MPPLDPPFDDEPVPPLTTGPGRDRLVVDQVRNRLAPGSRPPAGSRPARRRPPAPLDPLPLPAEALALATPEARQAAKRFLSTYLEICNGYRPASHLRPLTGPGRPQAAVGQLATGLDRLRALRRRAGGNQLIRVRLVRVCEPRPGVAEVAASLGTGGRSCALAARIERQRGSWIATALQVL